MHILRGFMRSFLLCATVCGFLGICFFALPQLVEHVQQLSLSSALDKRFGGHIRYEEITSTQGGWKLKNVHIDTPVAHLFCAECLLNTSSLPITLANITAIGDIHWQDATLPPCRLHVQGGRAALISSASAEPLLTWDTDFYELHALPCNIALSLLKLLSPHHPLESWRAESGTITGYFKRTRHDPSIDLTVKNLSLRLEQTPLRILLEEGNWHSTDHALCSGSSFLRCTLSTRVLEIPQDAWNLSIQRNGAHLTLQSNLTDVWNFLGAVKTDPEALLLDMHIPLHTSCAFGHIHLQEHALALPFTLELGENKQLKATLTGQHLPLSLFLPPLLRSLFPAHPLDVTPLRLRGSTHLTASMDYPDWQVEADFTDASCEIGNCLLSIGACQGPVRLAGSLNAGLHTLDAHVLRIDGLHLPSGHAFESLSGKVHIDKGTLTAYDLEGYLSDIHLTGQLTYLPLPEKEALTLHLAGASGKISALQKLFKDSTAFRFLATLPCDGDFYLSQEGATLTWVPSAPPQYQLSGSLLDLHLLDKNASMTTHDLSCQWRYDSCHNALNLYNLHGMLIVENGTDTGDPYFLHSDLLCQLNDLSPKIAFDFSVSSATEEMLRLAGEISSQEKGLFTVQCCPSRTHFGPAHPTEFTLLLGGQDAYLRSLDLELPLKLDESFTFIQRISRIPYCTIDPLLTEWLGRLKKVQGACTFSCHYKQLLPYLCVHVQSDALTIDEQTFHHCMLELQVNKEQCQLETLQWDGYRLSASCIKQNRDRIIPYLALQYKDTFLAGFEGIFNGSTCTLEGKIPLLTWYLPLSFFSPRPLCWTGSGTLSYRPAPKESSLLNLYLHGSLEKSPSLPDILQHVPPLAIHLEGNAEAMHASIQPVGDALTWPMRPLSLNLNRKSGDYLLKGHLKDPIYPLWIETTLSSPLSCPNALYFYDTPSTQNPLTLYLPSSQPISLPVKILLNCRIKGKLWGYTCDLAYSPDTYLIHGQLAWTTPGNPPPFMRTPLHLLPLKASWQLTGKGRLPSPLASAAYRGMLTVSRGNIHEYSLPAWQANVYLQPAKCTLYDLRVDDPSLSCTLKKITFHEEKRFHLAHLTAQEQPFGTKWGRRSEKGPLGEGCEGPSDASGSSRLDAPKSKECTPLPWHPHLFFPSLEIAFLSGSLSPPYHWTGEGSIRFQRPSTQKRLTAEDPMQKLIPLPEVFTPRQGTLHWSVQDGMWSLKALKHAYSEGKIVEFLLVPTRPATISQTGQLDITLEARPAKHRLRGTKRHVLHLQGPIQQPNATVMKES